MIDIGGALLSLDGCPFVRPHGDDEVEFFSSKALALTLILLEGT
ncbi:MAG: hypothetical protein WEA81_00080 [Dehalococcoidia bacterium]